MPGLPGDHDVERASGVVPFLELGHFDLRAMSSGELGHPSIHLDAEDPAPGRLELSSGDTGADSHIEHVASRAGVDDAVHQRLG